MRDSPGRGLFWAGGERPGRGVFGFFLAPVPLAGALGYPRRRDTWKGGEGRAASIRFEGLRRARETPGPTCLLCRASSRIIKMA